jgi:hypothetical protein
MSEFNWQERQIKYTPAFVKAIADERGIHESTVQGLLHREFIGGVFVEKWNEPTVAFPIQDDDGKIFRAHCRRWKDKQWVYEPYADPKVRATPALVYGNFATATKIYVFESQWDAISLIDILNLFDEIDAGEVSLITTRGAENHKKLAHFTWPQNERATVYTFGQNDDAGRRWLEHVIEIMGGAYVVPTPDAYNDVGEWVKDGHATACDVEAAIEYAEFRRPSLKKDDSSTAHAEQFKSSGRRAQGQCARKPLQQVEFPPISIRPCFRCYDQPFVVGDNRYKEGVYYHFVKIEKHANGKEKKDANGNVIKFAVDLWICSVLRVLHIVRSDSGNGHAYLLEYVPHGETQKRRAVLTQALLLGRGDEAMKELRDLGVSVLHQNAEHVRQYLDQQHLQFSSSKTPDDFWTSVKVIGWTTVGKQFVLPNEIIGSQTGVWFSGKTNVAQYSTKGDFETWKSKVAMPCEGNSYLILALSCAFAGPLLEPLNIPGLGIHYCGDSTTGKSTSLAISASAWGSEKFMIHGALPLTDLRSRPSADRQR